VKVNTHAPHSVSKVATVNEYYATLDGFGQRSIHQLLLDPDILMPGGGNASSEEALSPVPNLLYKHLPIGAIHILLDLLVHEAGPRIRSSLCHATPGAFENTFADHYPEATGVKRSPDRGSILLCVTFVALCRAGDSATIIDKQLRSWCDSCVTIVTDYSTPIFHPWSQLQIATHCAASNIDNALETARVRFVTVVHSVSAEDKAPEATMEVTSEIGALCVHMIDNAERLVLNTSTTSTFAPRLAHLLTTAIERAGFSERSLGGDVGSSLRVELDEITRRLARVTDPHGLSRGGNDTSIGNGDRGGSANELPPSGPSWDASIMSSLGAAIEILAITGRAARALSVRVIWSEEKVVSRSARERLRRLYASTLLLIRPILAAMDLILFLTLKLTLKTGPDTSKRSACMGRLLSAFTSFTCCLLSHGGTSTQDAAPTDPETPTKGYEQTIPSFVAFLQSRHYKEIVEFIRK
jgi:hypothetical protein